ncbi:hypothetical protein D5F01_LYC24727 [Larimichthys crocea]|uniref:Uncharacterized protein n=1 Tax=Larimichthys crocea TaxID=215358 RepID=A0A6G0HEA2_LARCR|nr:hypothetical protein D5F01_LYC24727 [Larimichthys crocea]
MLKSKMPPTEQKATPESPSGGTSRTGHDRTLPSRTRPEKEEGFSNAEASPPPDLQDPHAKVKDAPNRTERQILAVPPRTTNPSPKGRGKEGERDGKSKRTEGEVQADEGGPPGLPHQDQAGAPQEQLEGRGKAREMGDPVRTIQPTPKGRGKGRERRMDDENQM